jgi:hypothetical protein
MIPFFGFLAVNIVLGLDPITIDVKLRSKGQSYLIKREDRAKAIMTNKNAPEETTMATDYSGIEVFAPIYMGSDM